MLQAGKTLSQCPSPMLPNSSSLPVLRIKTTISVLASGPCVTWERLTNQVILRKAWEQRVQNPEERAPLVPRNNPTGWLHAKDFNCSSTKASSDGLQWHFLQMSIQFSNPDWKPTCTINYSKRSYEWNMWFTWEFVKLRPSNLRMDIFILLKTDFWGATSTKYLCVHWYQCGSIQRNHITL